jgi:hypothetical protein
MRNQKRSGCLGLNVGIVQYGEQGVGGPDGAGSVQMRAPRGEPFRKLKNRIRVVPGSDEIDRPVDVGGGRTGVRDGKRARPATASCWTRISNAQPGGGSKNDHKTHL